MGRLAALCVGFCALSAGLAAAAAAPPTMSYRVTSASSSARLVYGGESIRNLERTDGVTEVTARMASSKGAGANGSLTSRGGRISVKLNAKTVERATINQRTSETTPYVEQNCGTTSSRKTSGGFVLTRLPGKRVRVGWSFPHANAATCPGPRGVGRKLLAKMTHIYPASRFAARRVTLSVSGSAPFVLGAYKGTYRWRASMTLARLDGQE